MNYYLGIDIGATSLSAVVATEELDGIGRATNRTPDGSSEVTILEELLRTVEAACETGGVDPTEISAAGIGSIGPLDQDAGAIVETVNVSGTDSRIQLVQPLRTVLGTDRISLRNDAICGVIGERYVAESETENMVYLTMSTGIGAGVVVDGNVIFGSDGNAGEVGHMTIDPAGTMNCQCGAAGHWEAYCSGANIPHYAAHLRREEAIETELRSNEAGFTAKDVFDSVGEDDLATRVVERVGRWNTIGFANVVQAFAPTATAVGGAVALDNPDLVLDPIRQRISEHVMLDVPEIRLAELGEDVVLMGALLLARRHQSATDTNVS